MTTLPTTTPMRLPRPAGAGPLALPATLASPSQTGSQMTGSEAKDDLRSDFKAEVIPESRLLAVKMSCADKKSAKVVVEEIVGQHLENQKKINENKQLERSVMLNNLKQRYQFRKDELGGDL